MNINYLIAEHGEACKQNDIDVMLFIDEDKVSFYKKDNGFDDFTGSKMIRVFAEGKVLDNDIFLIENVKYRVFKFEEIRHRSIIIYTDVLLFEDDFIHDIEIYKQYVEDEDNNLPFTVDNQIISSKCRIETTSSIEYMEYAMHTDRIKTHTFTILSEGLEIELTNLIKWGERSFEVLEYVNIDERNKVLVVGVIERLSNEQKNKL